MTRTTQLHCAERLQDICEAVLPAWATGDDYALWMLQNSYEFHRALADGHIVVVAHGWSFSADSCGARISDLLRP